jgi:hypothetical protein
MGDSVGRWEGNTFVVDVVGFKPGGWLTGGLVTSDAVAPHRTLHARRSRSAQLRSHDRGSEGADEALHATHDADAARGASLRELLVAAENTWIRAVYEKMLKDPTSSASRLYEEK